MSAKAIRLSIGIGLTVAFGLGACRQVAGFEPALAPDGRVADSSVEASFHVPLPQDSRVVDSSVDAQPTADLPWAPDQRTQDSYPAGDAAPPLDLFIGDGAPTGDLGPPLDPSCADPSIWRCTLGGINDTVCSARCDTGIVRCQEVNPTKVLCDCVHHGVVYAEFIDVAASGCTPCNMAVTRCSSFFQLP